MVVDHQIVIEHMDEDLQLRCDCGGWAWYIPSYERVLAYWGLRAYDKHVAEHKATVGS
jgi:hypothetical protein